MTIVFIENNGRLLDGDIMFLPGQREKYFQDPPTTGEPFPFKDEKEPPTKQNQDESNQNITISVLYYVNFD